MPADASRHPARYVEVPSHDKAPQPGRSRILYTEVTEEGYEGNGWWAVGMARNDVVLRQGQEFVLDPIGLGGHTDLKFSSASTLPDGIVLDSESGAIHGIPVLLSAATTYIIQATSPEGCVTSEQVKLTIMLPPPDLNKKHKAVRYPVQKHIEPLKLLGSTWDPDLRLEFSCDPPLPTGLHLDSSVGEVFGLPQGNAGVKTHKITCIGSYGFVAEIDISIELLEKPSKLEYSTILTESSASQTQTAADRIRGPFDLQRGQQVKLEPTPVYGSSPMTFAAENLPNSFTIDRKTGVISGKAMKPTSGSWTVVVSNDAGSCRATIRVKTSDDARTGTPPLAKRQRPRPQSSSGPRTDSDCLKILVPDNKDRRVIFRSAEEGRSDPLLYRAVLERERSRPWFEGEFARFKRRPEALGDWQTISRKELAAFLARQEGSCLHHDAKRHAGSREHIFCRRCALRHVSKARAHQLLLRTTKVFTDLTRTAAAVRIQRWWREILGNRSETQSVAPPPAPAPMRQKRVLYHFNHERQPNIQPVYHPGQLVRRKRGHQQEVTAVCADSEKGVVYSASRDKTIGVWEPVEGRNVRTIRGEEVTRRMVKVGQKFEVQLDGIAHLKPVTAMCLSGTHGTVYTGGEDHMVLSWDAESGRGLKQFKGHLGVVTCLAQPRGRTVLLSGSEDQAVLVWDPGAGRLLRTLRNGAELMGAVHGLSYQEGVAFVGYGLTRRQLRAEDARAPVLGFDVETGHVRVRLAGHVGGVRVCEAVCEEGGPLLCTGGEDMMVRVWDARVSRREVLAMAGHTDRISCLAWSPSQAAIFSGSTDTSVRGWDLRKGKQVSLLRPHKEAVSAVSCCGSMLVSACKLGYLYTWSLGGLREAG